jgi:hypothetical protein
MLESQYQAKLINKIKKTWPGCIVLKNDSSYLQGIQDLLILYKDKWALLEVKASATAEKQPNQDYYVELANTMSFSAFIYPENELEVLYALQQTFQPRRKARKPQPK